MAGPGKESLNLFSLLLLPLITQPKWHLCWGFASLGLKLRQTWGCSWFTKDSQDLYLTTLEKQEKCIQLGRMNGPWNMQPNIKVGMWKYSSGFSVGWSQDSSSWDFWAAPKKSEQRGRRGKARFPQRLQRALGHVEVRSQRQTDQAKIATIHLWHGVKAVFIKTREGYVFLLWTRRDWESSTSPGGHAVGCLPCRCERQGHVLSGSHTYRELKLRSLRFYSEFIANQMVS